MDEVGKAKKFDLEERTQNFAKEVRGFLKRVPKSRLNFEDTDQLLRASGSVGANYIEAKESLSRKDFFMRAKICRKEARESQYWLELLEIEGNSLLESERLSLINEATELTKIFGSIVTKAR